MRFLVLLVFVFPWLSSCDNVEQKKPLIYEGPVSEIENLELYNSENGKIKLKMKAAMCSELANGDQEFPKGIDLEFYDETGKLTSVLHANTAYYFKEQNQWRGRGNVEIKNLEKSEQLNTEELFWKQDEQKIFTDKFVTIRQQNDVIYGNGLKAKEDLSDYEILDVTGTIEMNE